MSGVVAQLGPLGIFLLMVPESACIPIPSEVTLLCAGFGVHQGWFSLPVAIAAATGGNLAGSLVAYWLGRRGLLARLRGRGGAAVARCERLLERHRDGSVFGARLLPLARTFVSLPAGHVGVPLGRFIALTVAGCAIWSAAFIVAGSLAGSGWTLVASTAGRASLLAGALTVTALILAGAVRRRGRPTPARGRGERGRPPSARPGRTVG
jgi:membrane protein DedA with SNARE-associated domain